MKSLVKRICRMIVTLTMLCLILAGCAGTETQPPNGVLEPNVTEPSTPPVVEQAEPSPEQDEYDADWVKNAELKYNRADGGAVYFTSDISPEGLTAVYGALGAQPTGKVAVKITTGEDQSTNYLRPELIKNLVQALNGTIVECNTVNDPNLRRSNTEYHLQVAKDHGFTDIAEVDIMDSEGEISLPVIGGEILSENFVGSHFTNYDYYVVLFHFKGHAIAGFGGAIKNIAIGIASSSGKSWIHTGGKSRSGWTGDYHKFQQCMVEAGKSVSDYLKGNILYINVMNRLSIDCDCEPNPTEPDMHDIGILASFDCVALDQACVVKVLPLRTAKL